MHPKNRGSDCKNRKCGKNRKLKSDLFSCTLENKPY